MDYITKQLPNEILFKIFRDLSYQQRLKVATVCTKFNDIVRMMEQRRLTMSITPETLSDAEAFTALLQSDRVFEAIRIFRIFDPGSVNAFNKISKILDRFGQNLKELTIESCTVSPATLASLIAKATSLKLLNIRGLNYESLYDVPQPKRRRLNRSFYKTVTTLNLPHLEKVISQYCHHEYNIILLGLTSNTMKKFQFDGVWADVTFENFLHQQKAIESLELNAYGLEFKKLMSHLDLKRLKVHGKMTQDQIDDISQLRSLVELTINNQSNSYDYSLEFYKCWELKKLRDLYLSNTSSFCAWVQTFGFTEHVKPNQQLKKLVIIIFKAEFNPTSFQQLCDASPHLEHLEIHMEPTQEIVNSCLTSFPDLKYLSIERPYYQLYEISLRGNDVPNKNLETLIIGFYFISFDLQTVRLLAKSFPNLKHLEVWSNDEEEMLQASVVYFWTYLSNLGYLKQNGHERLRDHL